MTSIGGWETISFGHHHQKIHILHHYITATIELRPPRNLSDPPILLVSMMLYPLVAELSGRGPQRSVWEITHLCDDINGAKLVPLSTLVGCQPRWVLTVVSFQIEYRERGKSHTTASKCSRDKTVGNTSTCNATKNAIHDVISPMSFLARKLAYWRVGLSVRSDRHWITKLVVYDMY